VVTSVDSGGTESVQSLAVKPASAVTSSGSGGGGAALPACFIRAAGHPAMQPYLMIGLLVILFIGVSVIVRRKAQGTRAKIQK
jgi:hypothetical protein